MAGILKINGVNIKTELIKDSITTYKFKLIENLKTCIVDNSEPRKSWLDPVASSLT